MNNTHILSTLILKELWQVFVKYLRIFDEFYGEH